MGHRPNSALLCGALALALSSVSTLALAQEESVFLGTLTLLGERLDRELQDAPPSISVIPGEQAAHANNSDIDDIIDAEPNVLANEGFNPPAIRGVAGMTGGRATASAGSQPRIPVVVDGVALPAGEASNLTQTSTWDLNSVEVARGPQATSTGRNAIGGAIRVFTNRPEFTFDSAVRLRYTDQARAGIDLMLNTPLVENQLAFRFAAELSEGESYINNTPNPLPFGRNPNDELLRRYRAQLFWEPDEIAGLSVNLAYENTYIEGPTEGFYNGNIDDLSVSGTTFGLVSNYEIIENERLSLEARYEISDTMSLMARLAQQDNTYRFPENGELFFGALAGEFNFQRELTTAEVFLQFQEVGIINTGVVGIVRANEDETGFNNGQLLSFDLTGSIENTAIYGEVEVDASALLAGLAVIIGGRYERDQRTRTVIDGFGFLAGTASFDDDVFLPKLALRYDISEVSTIGYSYTEGYRAGGVDVNLSAPFLGAAYSSALFQPETLRQHEIYGRTTLANGALEMSASAFFYHWDNAQVAGAASYPASGASAIGNIPQAEGYGLEFAVTYRANEHLVFNGSLGLLKTEVTQVGAGQAAFLGESLPRAPEHTASLGVTYDSGRGLDAFAQARFVGAHAHEIGANRLAAYTIVDVGVGYDLSFGGSDLRIDAFVKNLFDERYQTFSESNAGNLLQNSGAPRTIGISATMSF